MALSGGTYTRIAPLLGAFGDGNAENYQCDPCLDEKSYAFHRCAPVFLS